VDPRHPAAVVFLRDPERSASSAPDDLAKIWGLTPAETAVALALARGEGVASVAARLGVQPSTVRYHRQHVFGKMGVHRQAQLARLLESIAKEGQPPVSG
jgi:DNA-binding NarL/FixJ family response regulator